MPFFFFDKCKLEYQEHGIDHLAIPTRDYLFAPSLVDISRAVDFIHSKSLISPDYLIFFQINLKINHGYFHKLINTDSVIYI